MSQPWPEVDSYLELIGLPKPKGAITLDELVDTIIPDSQRAVGVLWETGTWTVAQEHTATAAAKRLLESSRQRFPVAERRDETIVATCADGEWHALALESLATSAHHSGYDVVVTRPSTQPAHLSSLIHDRGPRAVMLSCSMAANLPGAYRMIRACLDTGTPVVVGGAAFGPTDERARLLGATHWSPRISAARDLIAMRTNRRTPATRHETPPEYAALGSPTIAVRLSQSLVNGSPTDVQAATIGSWLVRSLRASLLCNDSSIFESHVAWQAARSDALTDPPLSPILDAINDALPDDAVKARALVSAARG